MSLAALKNMGANTDQLRLHLAKQKQKLVPLGDSPDHKSYLNNLNHLLHQMDQSGWEAVLREELTSLQDNPGGGAFHGLIRTAYGVVLRNPVEVSAGLVYWRRLQTHAQSHDTPNADMYKLNPSEQFALLADIYAAADLNDNSLPTISERMQHVLKSPAIAQALAGIAQSEEVSFYEVAHAALSLFQQSHHFTALHGVTGTHAARILSPYVPNARDWLQNHRVALALAYLAMGAPRLDPQFAMPAQTSAQREALFDLATASTDEHEIKLAYSCWEDSQHYNDDGFIAVAYQYLTRNSAA